MGEKRKSDRLKSFALAFCFTKIAIYKIIYAIDLIDFMLYY